MCFISEPLDVMRQFCICGLLADFECSNCQSRGYCSQKCQEANWSEHYLVCESLKAAPKRRHSKSEELVNANLQGASTSRLSKAEPTTVPLPDSDSEPESAPPSPSKTKRHSFKNRVTPAPAPSPSKPPAALPKAFSPKAAPRLATVADESEDDD